MSDTQKVRFITATSLFDGHDAAINIMRRILQSSGAEVIHLGHNRSVEEIVTAAVQEDAQGIAVSAYQGGHVEFFQYMVDLLRERGGAHIRVFGGGGGVIVPEEIAALQAYGVTRLFSPEDGQQMGLQGMIDEVVTLARAGLPHVLPEDTFARVQQGDVRALATLITALENGTAPDALTATVLATAQQRTVPVLGITGTGGSGKSSLTDELVRRFRLDQADRLKMAIIAVDPSRRKTGGALLGDRIRMNAVSGPQLYMRSLATRTTDSEVPATLPVIIAACQCAGFDLIMVETPGIGQGNAAIVPLVSRSLYVMTPEFGAASQLEKIDMLDFADAIVINKCDRKGAEDALRDVRKQVQRNRQAFASAPDMMPVYGTIAARFNDDGVTALYHHLVSLLREHGLQAGTGQLPTVDTKVSTTTTVIVPAARVRYLAEVADAVRTHHRRVDQQVIAVRQRQHLASAKEMLNRAGCATTDVDALLTAVDAKVDAEARSLLDGWPEVVARYTGAHFAHTHRDSANGHRVETRSVRAETPPVRAQDQPALARTSLSGTHIPRVALPQYADQGELLRFLMRENVPGAFPYTAGVFPFKRENEDPTRMFAGEGDPFRTNRRFKQLSAHASATRLSTAFDSATLYGCDPDERPDIYGKVGNSGVSVATLDDMKALYAGFDLCASTTSVSMTINGPAPILLAMYFNTAFDQQRDQFVERHGRTPTADEEQTIRRFVLENVRGTVQADILKEDQGQNTCIFSTEFALKMMGDIQSYFVQHNVRNFYSVSISGYHIAEAGANPISQLAFTLANGFTYVEAYLARGMHIDDFAPNLSFFFSNGMEPEYTVIGRVARRIWAIALRDQYGANDRSQKLKYHIQTSGRSLHAQEMDFNDIRTTLQALIAIYDNCNSLHTNAYDEAITTPTDASARRALAIQLIINREWGLAKNENPQQGAFIIDTLTDLVEEAVLQEFERISERGGVLGAMETGYQRGKIQEESLHYEMLKHTGALPLIGVNTFRHPDGDGAAVKIELARSTEEEKQRQLQRLRDFQQRHATAAAPALARLKQAAMAQENLFAVLIDVVQHCSLGQMTAALFEVGGQYRRNM